MYTIPDRTAATLLPIIRENTRPGTTVMSDPRRADTNVGQIPAHRDLTVIHYITSVKFNCLVVLQAYLRQIAYKGKSWETIAPFSGQRRVQSMISLSITKP